jgi:hypothetical protein
MGRHSEPDSDFDEDTDAYPSTCRTWYRRGLLDGLIMTWSLVLAGAGVYVIITRWGHLILATLAR